MSDKDKSELKAELERKKQRLAQIREEKKRKEEERKRKEADQKKEVVQNEELDIEKKRREADALLQSMGITSEPSIGMYMGLIDQVTFTIFFMQLNVRHFFLSSEEMYASEFRM
ncbi:cytoplasmic dynein 1 intermediate chain 2 [Callorhinchus milii]|uniref:cytoplasmic dynein 1 intermediate chain 2 n=1 Tax=Callorhinchus milii TaxID=7868 RepID=UPI001C3F9D63|nr:cytoplasmic dynein 1 intermediate chain 2 [Callorhinchus milii]